ncbi:MAG: DNA mismatch repair protein MutS [Phycisphaerae bacterium]
MPRRSRHAVLAPPRASRPPAERRAAAPDGPTPAMRQYLEQKAQVGDAILLFRIGDFYETFYDDAKLISAVLGLTLTARNKDDPQPIPLAGVPYHAVDHYVARLIRAGHRVAISEQVEDAAAATGVVRREIVRIITPGTLTEEKLLDERHGNWLAALCAPPAGATPRRGGSARASDDLVGLAAVELSSGRFFAQIVPARQLLDELARLRPAEVLLPRLGVETRDPLAESIRETLGAAVTPRPAHGFEVAVAQAVLHEQFGVASLEGLGFDAFDAALQAAGAIVAYLRETQRAGLPHLLTIERRDGSDSVRLDPAALRALEVERTARDAAREGSLLWAVDRTRSPMGARRLREWLCYPLRDPAAIRRRQSAVQALHDDRARLERIRERLGAIGDLERIAGRLGVGRSHPRELAQLGRALASLATLRGELHTPVDLPEPLVALAVALSGMDPLAERLTQALRPDAPATPRDGGYIADGFDAELDRLRTLARDGQRLLAEYQASESARTGIPSLKVAYNSVFGYYLEITHTHRDKVPADYVRRQTVRAAERYTTETLRRLESDLLSAQQRSIALEAERFAALCAEAVAELAALRRAADAVATLDVFSGLAALALERGYVRPELIDPPADAGPRRAAGVLEIVDGRHPVLDQTLGARLVPNDCRLDAAERVLVITGPNMAGKSTYIRQVALLTLLSQCGSFVPARAMRLTPIDRLFARVGASDELARGQSTFMVEMVEAARIANTATAESLVILDELGRGTSTFDGLALAWAMTEHLARRIGCRALFATHYHELTELAESVRGVANRNVAVQEVRRPDGREEVVFLHRIVPGGTDKSYGIHVARLAGVPASVIARAVEVLGELESSFAAESRRVAGAADARQPTLFPPVPPPPAWWEALAAEIARLDLDRTTPIDALGVLRDVQARLRETSRGANPPPE